MQVHKQQTMAQGQPPRTRKRRGKASAAASASDTTVPAGALLYSKPQMAAALQISQRILEELMERDGICALKISPRVLRFWPERVLLRLCETSEVGTPPGLKKDEGQQSEVGCHGVQETNTNQPQP